MKTSTLRFVTIRNPEPSHGIVSTLPFDPVILKTSADYIGSLYQKLDDVYKNASLKSAEKIKAIKDAAQAFKSSTSFISDASQLDSLHPGFTELREWLVSRRSVALDDPHGEAERTLHLSASRTLAAKQLLNLTDNLIAYIITDGDPVIREKISLVLRMNNVLQKAATVRGARDLRKLINAPVILPDVVFLPVVRENKPAAEPRQDPIAERKQQWEKLKHLSAAHDELAAARTLQVDPKRGAQPRPQQSAGFVRTFLSRFFNPETAPPEPPTDDLALSSSLRREHMASLSTETTNVLSELQIMEGAKFTDALAKVERSAQEVAAQIGRSISPFTEQVLIGNALVNRNDLPDKDLGEGPEIFVDGDCEFKFPFKIADLRIVEQELKDYLAGEVAHVENILQGELKERGTRRLKTTEDTVFTSEEREETNEKDTQTTNRFQLEQEISKTVKKDSESQIDAKVDSQYYGYINVQSSFAGGFSTSNSEEQSTRDAVTYAKDVVERSAQKIIERVKNERTRKTTESFEENNRHLLNNVGGQHHVVGVYRWLNKDYRVWLKNYGKRLMFEIMIPEPAAFHIYAMKQKKDDLTRDLNEPMAPNDPEWTKKLGIPALSSYTDITPLNYPIWAAAYGADVTPPPPASLTITTSLAKTDQAHTRDYVNTSANALTVPTGYIAQTCSVRYDYHSGPLDGSIAWGTAVVGLNTFSGAKSGVSMNGETGTIPVSMEGFNLRMLLHVEVVCVLLQQALDEWRIKIYKAIRDAYEAKRAEYENALAEARAGAGVVIRGSNPLFNQTIIQTELKKNAIRLMAHCNPMYSSAMTDTEGGFNCCQVMSESPYIKFVEQVFEWRNMVYEFYPYHWAAKTHWTDLYNLSDTDPLFQSFLKAGYARVLVPVTPGYDKAALNFVQLGTPDLHDLASLQVMDIVNGMDENLPTLAPARVSTQSNIDIANPAATIDGVALAAGDRVLVRNETVKAENGVYIWNGIGVPMTRAIDADDPVELAQAVIEVTEGTDKDFKFRQTELALTTIGTDPIIFRVAAEIVNESLLIPTELTILECQSAGVEPTTMKILGLCQTVGLMTPVLSAGTTPDSAGH